MQKKSSLLGCLKENKKGRHAEFISASHLVAVLKRGEILNQVQDDNFIFKGVGPVLRPYGAPLRSGFTLIELLVVVLIIGILAAVALPQYQKAVMKSRYATLKDITKSMADAEEIYYMANGKYSTSFDELDIDTPANFSTGQDDTHDIRIFSWGTCNLGATNVYCYNKHMGYQIYYHHISGFYIGKRRCIAFSVNSESIANRICKQETNASSSDTVNDIEIAWVYK